MLLSLQASMISKSQHEHAAGLIVTHKVLAGTGKKKVRARYLRCIQNRYLSRYMLWAAIWARSSYRQSS